MKIKVGSLLLLGLASMAMQSLTSAHAAPLPPDTIVAGKTQAEWSAEYAKWALSFPSAQNPILDTTGAFGHLGNVGPVFFVAASPGGHVSREISVPAGKPLFFPLVTGV